MSKKILKLIAIVLCTVMVFLTGMDLYKLNTARKADYFVRIAYTGVENMFHDRYEYYAIVEDRSVLIPEKYVPDNILYSYVGTLYDDTQSDYWYVQLVECDREYPYKGDGYEKSTLGDGMYLTWSRWTKNTQDPEEKELEIFRSTAEFFQNSSPDSWVWEDGKGNRGLKAFMLVRNNGRYLIVDEKKHYLYKLDPNGNLSKIMVCPDRGDYNYFWFDWEQRGQENPAYTI